jgi:hypothetical protein
MRWASRDTFRLALFLCTMPRCAARMMTGSAALNAAKAALRSPLLIASSTLRTEFRNTERRALLTSVRRAITRVALRADFVLAINLSFAVGASGGLTAKSD